MPYPLLRPHLRSPTRISEGGADLQRSNIVKLPNKNRAVGVKTSAVLFTCGDFYSIMYLLDKLEFGGDEGDRNNYLVGRLFESLK